MKARDLLLFHTLDKKVNVSVYFRDGTFWLTQKAMAELFGVNVPAVSKHLRNIFETGELNPDSVISKMETTAADGYRQRQVVEIDTGSAWWLSRYYAAHGG